MLVRQLAWGAIGAALLGAILSVLPIPLAASTFALGVGVALTTSAAWVLGRAPVPAGETRPAFARELAYHASSLVLLVVFILLALVELLAIPAAMGRLVVFSTIGIAFVQYYPLAIAALLSALAGAVLLASGGPSTRAVQPAERALGQVAGALTCLFVLASIVVASGAFDAAGLRPERSAFVLAAALVALFFFVKTWLRLPTYAEVSDWLEHTERVRETRLLARAVYGLLALASVGVVLSLLPAAGLAPRGVGIFGMGVSMLALLGATYNVGVTHVVAKLEMGLDNMQDARKRRRIILHTTSIGLTTLGVAVGLLTFLAFLAQVASVEIFRFLLEAYVAYYYGIFAFVLVPLGIAVAARTVVRSEVPYSPKLQALAITGATLTIVLVFFGVFIGSGLAEGSGIQIENAVLVLGGAMLSLILFVKARTLLPSVVGIIREAVTSTAQADKPTQDRIRRRMVLTYVAGLAFVLSFAAYVVATSTGVVPAPTSSLGVDVGFFLYVMVGIAVLVVVVMRYFQSVSIDQRWTKQREENTIGKKRLTSAQVQRYLILGFSIGMAVVLSMLGALIQLGLVKQLGPLTGGRVLATDLFVFAILIGIGPYGLFAAREARRVEAIDHKFPEFLRDLAESQRAGMTLTEAVLTASRGQYGVLTGEIRKMAAQIEWGVSFQEALERFAKRVETPLIERTVSLIIQASNAGGNVVDVLTAAAEDAREIQQIVKERKQQMSIYTMIIYIAFAVFIGVIAVLNAQFIPEVAKAVSKADGVTIGGLHFRAFDQQDFKILFFHAAVIQGLGGGMVGGVMSQGKLVHGLRHSFIMVAIAWVLFRLVIG